MIKSCFHAIFGLVAYFSVVLTLVISVPIFLLGLDDSTHNLIPAICDINIALSKSAPIFPSFSACTNNFILFSIFGATHSIMSTLWFKPRMAKILSILTFGIVNEDWDRSIFIFVSSTQLYSVMYFYQSMPEIAYEFSDSLKFIPYTVNALGVCLLLACTIQLDHLEFFGLRKALKIDQHALRIYPAGHFIKEYLYGFCRHPIMVALFLMFWSFPVVTFGHLQWSVMTTGYIFLAVFCFEEPRLVSMFPETYNGYKKETGAFCPMFGKKRENGKKVE